MASHQSTRRLSYEELAPPLREMLAARVDRLGYLGEFFQRAGHQPEALMHFIAWTEALKQSVPFRLVEVVALTIASETRNDYERVQHERLALLNGFTSEEVVSLAANRAASCPTFAPEEVAVAMLAHCLADNHGNGCDAALLRLRRIIGEPMSVGCLMVAARYLAHAAMANAWQLTPPVGSPLASSEPHA